MDQAVFHPIERCALAYRQCTCAMRWSLQTVFAVALAFLVAACGDAQSTQTLTIETRGGPVQFTIEFQQTPEELARGLMFREELGRNRGMLFDFGEPREVTMWMKNTLIDLDILYLDGAGRVVQTYTMKAQEPQREDETDLAYE